MVEGGFLVHHDSARVWPEDRGKGDLQGRYQGTVRGEVGALQSGHFATASDSGNPQEVPDIHGYRIQVSQAVLNLPIVTCKR